MDITKHTAFSAVFLLTTAATTAFELRATHPLFAPLPTRRRDLYSDNVGHTPPHWLLGVKGEDVIDLGSATGSGTQGATVERATRATVLGTDATRQ